MRRADRLFRIVQIIRGRRLTTAGLLAQRLEVSQRTVYRDVADLQRQGVPIEGEAGVGYRLGAGYDMPPLMFTHDEARALVASVRMAQAWQDPALAQDAEAALGKILSVLPSAARAAALSQPLFAPLLTMKPAVRERLGALRAAIGAHQRVALIYHDAKERPSRRVVRPLGCFYWGKDWTLAAWCETRRDFRAFRLDRTDSAQVVEGDTALFRDEAGKTLTDYLRQVVPPGARTPWVGAQ